jgi:hypothetical protein
LSFTTSCSAVVVEVDVLVVELAERLKTIQTSTLTARVTSVATRTRAAVEPASRSG